MVTRDELWAAQEMLLSTDKDCGLCGHPLADHDVGDTAHPGPFWCRIVECTRCRGQW